MDVVSIPLWLAVIAGVLAAWAAYDKLLMPALRWFLAGRTNVVLEEVSTRLRISVRPFQRTRRQILIHRLLGDPNDPGSQRAMEAMMEMKKIDIAKLEEAKAGAGAGAR